MNEQQEKFAIEYAHCGNATQAAKNAGYSENSAEVQGCRLLKNDKVQAKIEELREQQAQELRKKLANEALTAFKVLVDVMNSADAKDGDKIRCAIDILDRAGYAAEKKLEIRSNEDKSLERLKKDMAYDDLRAGN